MYDAVVIGGGPIGSYTAGKLAETGHDVVVLERGPQAGTEVCCTGIVSQECVSAFNIDDSVILKKANSARLFSPSGNLLHVQREENQACILDRTAFDLMMANRAINKGAEYLPDRLVSRLENKDNRVEIEVFHHGEKTSIEARVAVIATGFGSKLTERLGMGITGDYVVGAQAEVATTGVSEVEVYLGRRIAPGFFGWLVPTSALTARVGLLSRENPRGYLKQLMTSLREQGKLTTTEANMNSGGIPLQPMSRTCGERVIAVGDAAGQVKPTTGGGIYFGLLCADIAAATLHQALKSDDLSSGNLAGYERKWRRRLGRELKTGYRARKLFERLSDRQINRLFDIIKANGIDKALLESNDVSFDWHGRAIPMVLGRAVVARILGRTPASTKAGQG